MKKLLALTVSAALAASATSAFAESLADTITARPSTEATVGFHLSLGGKANAPAKPVYGASLGFRAGGQSVSQSLNAPVAKFAEFNVAGGKVEDARLGAMNFARTETAAADGERLGLAGSPTAAILLVGLVAAAVYFIIESNNGGDIDGGY